MLAEDNQFPARFWFFFQLKKLVGNMIGIYLSHYNHLIISCCESEYERGLMSVEEQSKDMGDGQRCQSYTLMVCQSY